MALPSTGTISASDFRTEMGQTGKTDYSIGAMATAPWSGNASYYTPINVHSTNNTRYPIANPVSFSDWYSYDNSLTYSPSDTFRDMTLNWAGYCYASILTVYDLGTTNGTFDLTVSGSAADFSGIDYVRFFYGQPWNSAGTTTGSYAPVHEIYVNQSAYNQTYSYSYTYDSGRGQKLYCVATAGCY